MKGVDQESRAEFDAAGDDLDASGEDAALRPAMAEDEGTGTADVEDATDDAGAGSVGFEAVVADEAAGVDPFDVFDTGSTGGVDVREASAHGVFPGPRVGDMSRRKVAGLVVVGAVAVVAVLGCAVFVGTNLVAGATASTSPTPTARPAVSAAPRTAELVTLPGWSSEASWSVQGVDQAAVTAGHVLAVVGGEVQWRAAETGEVQATTNISGSGVRVLTGFVSGVSAGAAVSDTEALVWVDGAVDPLRVVLGEGRALEVRSGVFVVTGPDRTFWMVSGQGEVPVSAPHPEGIVLGAAGDAVVWASAPNRVSVASANGTVISDAVLTAPGEGAVITPRRGWVRAVSAETVVVGWTLPDGSQLTGVHATSTGALVSTIPGTGEGVLSPDGDSWLTDGHLVDVTGTTLTPLPEGFTASRFLGRALFGATPDGTDALLSDGDITPVTDAPTVRVIAAAGDGTVVSLTAGSLAAFAPAD